MPVSSFYETHDQGASKEIFFILNVIDEATVFKPNSGCTPMLRRFFFFFFFFLTISFHMLQKTLFGLEPSTNLACSLALT